jgi:sugar/nucleoside kinase (ribokinase family)
MALPDPESESGKVNWKKILERILPFTDIFLPSFEEIFFMIYPEKFLEFKKKRIEFFEINLLKKISEEILKLGGKIVGIKCGKNGFYVRTAKIEKIKDISVLNKNLVENFSDREIFIRSLKVKKIASALGAGDAAVAGFLMGILRGETIENTLKLANCVGAQNLTFYDAISGIKSYEETKKMLKYYSL